jgi:hypothetical protein
MSPECLQRIFLSIFRLETWEGNKVMPLTDIQIKALQPRDKRYLVSDGRGLSLDVLPSGFKSWIYRYTLNGKAEKVTLGPYPDLTLKLAHDKRDKLAAAVVVGQSPAAEKKARREGRGGHQTVRQFGDRYYREQVVRNRKNPTEIERYLERENLSRLWRQAAQGRDGIGCAGAGLLQA